MVAISSYSSSSVQNSALHHNEKATGKSLGRIASGKSINAASDNAAGLAVASQLLADVSGLRQAGTNLVQGTAVLQTADGALDQSGKILGRMKELATQANNGALDSNARTAINTEYQNLKTELDNISSTTNFNGQSLVNGTYNNNFQAGTDATNLISADLSSVNTSSSGLGLTPAAGGSAGALLTPSSAQATSSELDSAIARVSAGRATIGSIQSSFTTRADVVDTQIENTLSAQSSIIDTDIGKEMSRLATSKLLTEASIASAVQGNNMKSSMLKLVR